MKLCLIKCAYVLSGVLIFLNVTFLYSLAESKNHLAIFVSAFFVLIFIIILKHCEGIIIAADKPNN